MFLIFGRFLASSGAKWQTRSLDLTHVNMNGFLDQGLADS